MRIRTRKFVGALALIALVGVWPLIALAVSPRFADAENAFFAAAFYVIAGLGWLLLAVPLVRWMSRPDDRTSARPHPPA